MNGADALASCPRWLDRHTPASVLVFHALQVGDMLCAVPALRVRCVTACPTRTSRSSGCRGRTSSPAATRASSTNSFPFRATPRAAPPHAFPEFLHAVRRRRFDLALQLHGDGCVSNSLLAQFDALWQAGFAAAGSSGESFLRYPEVGHEIHRLLELTTHLGAPSRGDGLHFPLLDDDARELAAAPLKAPRPGAPYVCLHPGARDPARRWPVARFAALGDAFAAQGMQVVLTGSDDERALATQVAHAMCAPAINAAAPISLGAMARLMAGATLLVCNDTGVSHVACGLGLPSVVIFRASDMARWAPLDRARHRALWDPDGEREGAVLYEALDLLLTTSANSASA